METKSKDETKKSCSFEKERSTKEHTIIFIEKKLKTKIHQGKKFIGKIL